MEQSRLPAGSSNLQGGNGSTIKGHREGQNFEYVLKLWVDSKHGEAVPKEMELSISQAFNEFFDRVDRIFKESKIGSRRLFRML